MYLIGNTRGVVHLRLSCYRMEQLRIMARSQSDSGKLQVQDEISREFRREI